MSKNVLFAGVDVDENSFNVSLISRESGEIFHFKCRPNVASLIKKLNPFKEKGAELKICYESTYLGFSLCRDIKKHGYDCEVIASSLIPELPGKKIKTDKLDSKDLAIYYMQNMLTIVNMPTKEDESERDLLRSRALIVQQMADLKKHITALCKRMNIDYKNNTDKSEFWTRHHRQWLNKEINQIEPTFYVLKINLEVLISTLNQLETMVDKYDNEINKLSHEKKYQRKVSSLCAFRGIQTLTAMTVITEIGDIKRFINPKKLVSYLGLDIIEYSSGGREKKYGITKMGNARVRTSLLEASQSAKFPPRVSKALRERRRDAEPKQIEVADRCMKRLNKKAYHMSVKGKNNNIIKTACSREMVGFIWESLMNIAA